MAKKQKESSGQGRFPARIELSGFTPEDTPPEMTVYALDRSGKPIESSRVDGKGQFELSDKAVKASHRIAIGPSVEDLGEVERTALTVYRPQQFVEILQTTSVFDIPQKDWLQWFYFKFCVSGSVKRCYPYPWYINQLVARTNVMQAISASSIQTASTRFTTGQLSDAQLARPSDFTIPPFRCEVVCDGIVEVYRRVCCCTPWIVYDPRTPELIKELEDLVFEVPDLPWPPRPQPDPPFQELPFFKDGALDEKALNARQDLHALQTLPQTEVAEYIQARPYLWCSCSTPTKVAEGAIHPDGDFHICWNSWPIFTLPNCHVEYAYRVKQVFNGITITIYDGVAANKWFHSGEEADLVSYSPFARGCRHNDFPGDGAFVLLQDIGDTGSWRLKTPDSTGWDRVANPVYNDGLAFPAANAAAAVGQNLDRNWGGTLKLRYHFSEAMKDIGARYYRVSVVGSDNNGNPTGPRTYLSPADWYYYEFSFPFINVDKVSLGPNNVGGQGDLYEIPYDADRDWQSGQYHALLDTTDFTNGRFLLTVEVFDAAGNLIRPTGTPDPGGSVQGAFTYRRWFQEVGPTSEVPFAALTHMLWWDNRKAEAKIEDFRVNGLVNTAECQFLEDNESANFSVGYRAYHPEPMFMLDHRMWWRRGLGGPTGILTSPHPNPSNVGVPPALPHQSGSNTFDTMLGSHTKCTFTINLHTNVKTFNGEQTLNGLDDWDTASVALEIV